MGRFSALPTAAITDDSAVGGQIIQGSTIFDTNHSAYLSRTPSSAGNRKTYTVSVWVKKSSNDAVYPIFSRYTDNNESGFLGLYLNSDNNIYFTGWSTVYLKTSRIYRDTNAWSHIVLAVDTTQASSSNRIKLYFNGELQTFVTYNAPSQNADLVINANGAEHRIGNYSTNYFNGQMTEMHFIGGQALDSSYFGYTDFQTGIWRPKRYEGTYGTNGFYLPLDGSHHIGKDMSGNGCDWTPNNLRGTVPLHMATGGLPILNTNSGGTTACPGVRPDPLASNIVLALPLSDASAIAVGTDVHHLVKGSGSAKTLTNNGSIDNKKGYSNFYGFSGAVYLQNANSQNIGISASDDFNFGTGDLTIECWVYPTSTSAADGSLFVTHNGSTYFAFNFDPGTRFNIYFNSGSGTYFNTSESSIENTKWNHVALVRNSGVFTLYVNGKATDTHSYSGQIGYNASDTTICRIGGGGGSSVNSYIQDMRIYKGVAKYTENFTCASTDSSVIPESPSGLAVSRKFEPSLSGSVGFEGITSYLSVPHSTDLNLTNQDFCLEAFIYPVGESNSQFAYVFNKGFSLQITFRNNSNTSRIIAYMSSAGSGSYDIVDNFHSGNGSVPLFQWTHIALIRTSGTMKWFINGVEKASTSASAAVHSNTSAFTIGTYLASSGNYEFKGSISNVRITVGEAVYTSNFTPPSEPLTLTSQSVTSSNVKLLCCKDKLDETAADKIPTGSITRVNNAYATAFSPFGDDTTSRASSYANINYLRYRKAGSVSEGGLFLSGGNYVLQTADIIFGPGNITTGKYYWEIDNKNGNGTSICYQGLTSELDQSAGEIHSQANKSWFGTVNYKPFNTTSITTIENKGEGTFSIALDVDARTLKAYVHNRLIYTDTNVPDASITNYAPFIFSTNDGSSGSLWSDAHVNFGQRPFTYTPPDGYGTISIANIPVTPNITNSNSLITKPQKFFQTFQYTGDGSSSKTVTGLSFKPDLIWQKDMSSGYHNRIWDSVRGWNSSLFNNRQNQEDNYYDYGVVRDIGPGHVTFEQWLHSNFLANKNNDIRINWCWKAGTPEVPTNGSIFCAGSADYLTVGGHSDLDFGSGNFTIEGYFNTNKHTNSTIICSNNYFTSGTNGNWVLRITDSTRIAFASYDGNSNEEYTEFTVSYKKRQWHHFALVREGTGTNQTKLYIDGSIVGSMTQSKSLSAGSTGIGIGEDLSGANQEFKGYISNIRIVKGTAVYTSNFTPSTTPLTNITNTKLLCCQSNDAPGDAAVAPLVSGKNSGTQWSHYLTGGGGFQGSYPARNAFNGTTTGANTSRSTDSQTTQTFRPPGGISYSSSVEVWTWMAGSVSLNGGSNITVSNDQSFRQIASGSGTINSIAFNSASGNSVYIAGIRVDGTILVDPMVVNDATHDISQNPFDAFSVDGIGYSTAAAATAATTSNLTAGNISISKASVNTEAGFSIIMYTGSGGQGNIPHGLEHDPDMIVVKGITNDGGHWQTWHSSFGTGSTVNRVYWSSNTSVDTSSTNKFQINAGAGTILLNTGDQYFNQASHQYIMYCWHSVPGYSKFGYYYGNGQSSDGKFVYTGFRPAFVLLKRSSGSANNWEQRDNVRDPYNPATSRLFANTTDTPSVGEGVDFLSNGFKIRNGGTGSNANDHSYLYMAYAEQPLTTPFGTSSNAR